MQIPHPREYGPRFAGVVAARPDGLVRPVSVVIHRHHGAVLDLCIDEVETGFVEGNLREATRRACRKAQRRPVVLPTGLEIHPVCGGTLEKTLEHPRRDGLLDWCGHNRTWKRHRGSKWRQPAQSFRLMAAAFAEMEAAATEWWHDSVGVLMGAD